jgi:hypothetical protein
MGNIGFRNFRGSSQIPLFEVELFEALPKDENQIHLVSPGLN